MKKKKIISKLEAIIDALEQSKPVVSHNPIETERVIDKIIDYQGAYKDITGHYYSPNRGGGKHGKR